MMGRGICALVRGIGFDGGWEVSMERTWMLRGVGIRKGDEWERGYRMLTLGMSRQHRKTSHLLPLVVYSMRVDIRRPTIAKTINDKDGMAF